jgi:hypothetical protein
MAYIPRSSFIPKEASGAIPLRVRRKRTIHVFSLLTTLLFLASLVSAVGVYLYQDFLENRLVAAKAALNEASASENDAKIEEIRIYDNKLNIAHTILDNHLAPSYIFEEIENSTKETVQFQNLEYTYDPGFDALLTLGGNTEEFTSLALQKMQFLEDTMFEEFIVGDISTSQDSADSETQVARNTDSDIAFKVTGLFKKGLIEYTGESLPVTETTELEPVSDEPISNEVTPTL